MKYPTLEQVNQATHYRICFWYRFLPSPGSSATNRSREEFEKLMAEEVIVMNAICDKLKEFGGFTPQISKMLDC
jgi:hypothetical protein